MKISPIQNYKINKTNFKGLCLYTGIYTPEPDEFVKSSNDIDIEGLKKLRIPRLRLIDSTSVRGATLETSKPEVLAELKKCGIKRVIDLRKEGGIDTEYANNCRKNGLDYFNIVIPNPIEKKDIQVFLNKLPKFFEIMNIGKNYVACFLGLHRTDLATSINYLMNPKEPSSPPVLSHIFDDNEKNCTNIYIGVVKNLRKYTNEKICAKTFNERIFKLCTINGFK